jgi:hypothetical protein
MKMDIGDIVVCVDASPGVANRPCPLTSGSRYIVADAAFPGDMKGLHRCTGHSIMVAGYGNWWFGAFRFRKIEPGDLIEEPRRETAPRELEPA